MAKKSYSTLMDSSSQRPGFNPWPFVIVFVGLGVGIFFCVQNSWIGQIMQRGPVQEDPMDRISPQEARQLIHQRISESLASVGATAEYKWAAAGTAGTEADMSTAGPVELTITTKLPDPNMRRGIVDPVKDMMYKAQIPTLVMTDQKSRATWTYSVQAPPQKEEEPPLFEPKKHAPQKTVTTSTPVHNPFEEAAADTYSSNAYSNASSNASSSTAAGSQVMEQEGPPTSKQRMSIDQIYAEERYGDYSNYRNNH